MSDVDGLHLEPDPAAAGIVAVCHAHLEARGEACARALGLGAAVLCAPPPAASPRHVQGLLRAAAGRGRLECESPAGQAFVAAAAAAVAGVGPVVYARLRLAVGRRAFAAGRCGIVESDGLWLLPFLEGLFGTADTVAAHTRALLRRDQPTEDIAVAHLEFASGVEGLLEVHALADGPATVELEAYGDRGVARVARDLDVERGPALREHYRRLRDHVRGATTEPAVDLAAAVAGARWLRQSARLGARLHRRERKGE